MSRVKRTGPSASWVAYFTAPGPDGGNYRAVAEYTKPTDNEMPWTVTVELSMRPTKRRPHGWWLVLGMELFRRAPPARALRLAVEKYAREVEGA